MRRILLPVTLVAGALVVPAAATGREPYPHEFHQNMGYCAPFLAQQRLPDRSAVRPWINHLLHDFTAGDLTFEGQTNVGDLYSDRARSDTDTQCVAR